MIRTKDHKTGHLLDPWRHLGPKRRRLLDESWAGFFREHILEELPVEELGRHYRDGFGRPTKELYTVMGVVLLQQMHDLTDEETVDQLSFSEQWHYALDLTDESDESKYICPKTLWTARKIFTDNGIDGAIFTRVGDKLSNEFKVNRSKQRLDSKHIKSNMRRMGRIGIMSGAINKFLVNLKRRDKELFDSAPEATVERYFTKEALGCFSMVKPSESSKTLEQVGLDLYELIELFSNEESVCSMNSYSLLKRVFDDNCEVAGGEGEDGPVVIVKPPKEIPAHSVQNPSDPDAGYDGHKGQGYQVQVMETYSDEADPEARRRTLNLITHLEVESAAEHDSRALIPAIESTKERGLSPEILLADSHYGGDENVQKAKSMGTEVVSPVMGAPPVGELGLEDFEFSEDGKVDACPAGEAPANVKVKTKKGNVRYIAAFVCAVCEACKHRKDCPVKTGKKSHYLRYDEKSLRVAKRRKHERGDEFRQRYRWRAGVEATMSEYDRLTSVKRLRVRGLKAVRLCATLKATGVNIFRGTAVRNAMNAAKNAPTALNPVFQGMYFYLKTLFEPIRMKFNALFSITVKNQVQA